MKSLIYMAKPVYGGWVTFTAHLANQFGYPVYKIGKRTEGTLDNPRTRDFGYGVRYQNISLEDAKKLKNILITAIDKNYYKLLPSLDNKKISIVIHDPTEVKGKSTQPVLDFIQNQKIITIRPSVQQFLKDKWNLKSTFKYHPFFPYSVEKKRGLKKAVSISRIDYDKNTDIILKTNQLLPKKIPIYGAKNDLYVYRILREMDSMKKEDPSSCYQGTFKKSFRELSKILSQYDYMIDLSTIHHDGGGSQYTFLEAIHNGCALILNRSWVEGKKTPFRDGYNCILVSNEDELLQKLQSSININKLVKNAKKLLLPHTSEKW